MRPITSLICLTSLMLCIVPATAAAQKAEAKVSSEAAPTAAPATTAAPAPTAASSADPKAADAGSAEPASADAPPSGEAAAPAAVPAASLGAESEEVTSSGYAEAQDAPAPPSKKKKTSKKNKRSQKQVAAKKKVAPPPEPEIDGDALPFTYHQTRIDVLVGAQVSWVGDSAYDAFADDDTLGQFVARAGSSLFSAGRLSVAALGEYAFGATGSSLRGASTSLDVHRFGLGVEGRYHLTNYLSVYGRLAPSAFYEDASVGNLSGSTWGFALPATAGAQLRLAGSADGRVRSPRLFVFLEGGYSFFSETSLSLLPGENGPLRPVALDLGPMSLSSPQLATGAVMTF